MNANTGLVRAGRRNKAVVPSTSTALVPRRSNNREMTARPYASGYYGDVSNLKNASVIVPSEENVAFFVKDLPPKVDVGDMLRNLRNTGRIYQVHVKEATPPAFPRPAAKFSFFDQTVARKFWDELPLWPGKDGDEARTMTIYHAWGPPVRCMVVPERNGRMDQRKSAEVSRILRFKGPPEAVCLAPLLSFLSDPANPNGIRHCFIESTDQKPKGSLVESMIAFGSFHAQAQAAWNLVKRRYGRAVKIRYDVDPCASPHTPEDIERMRGFRAQIAGPDRDDRALPPIPADHPVDQMPGQPNVVFCPRARQQPRPHPADAWLEPEFRSYRFPMRCPDCYERHL
ncbi:hypothetical protein OQA88_3432 [Cercophora sp. LCS_1]